MTTSQLVLAWLMSGDPPVLPIVGATTVEQIEESLKAADLNLETEPRNRLDSVW